MKGYRFNPLFLFMKFNNIKYSVKGKSIFRSFNLEIDSNIHFIKGANGAGKTTLLKILAGLINVENKELKAFVRQNNEELMYLSTEVIFFEDFSFKNTLKIYASLFEKQWKIRAKELIDLFSLEKVFNTKYSKLSTGEKKKFMFIFSDLVGKKYVLIDEMFESVDSKSKSLMFELLSSAKNDKNFIISTHTSVPVDSSFEITTIIN